MSRAEQTGAEFQMIELSAFTYVLDKQTRGLEKSERRSLWKRWRCRVRRQKKRGRLQLLGKSRDTESLATLESDRFTLENRPVLRSFHLGLERVFLDLKLLERVGVALLVASKSLWTVVIAEPISPDSSVHLNEHPVSSSERKARSSKVQRICHSKSFPSGTSRSTMSW